MANIKPVLHYTDPTSPENWVSVWPPVLDTPPSIQINTPDTATAVYFTKEDAPKIARAILEAAGLTYPPTIIE